MFIGFRVTAEKVRVSRMPNWRQRPLQQPSWRVPESAEWGCRVTGSQGHGVEFRYRCRGRTSALQREVRVWVSGQMDRQ